MIKNYKVVFHIDDVNNWEKVIANVYNLLKDFSGQKDQINIKIMANANAVNYYKIEKNNSEKVEKFKKIQKNNVEFIACENSLKMNELKKEAMYPFIQTVPAAVSELIKLQANGHAYIKI